MPVTTRLSDVIRSSRQRMQAGLSPSVVKSARKTGGTREKQKGERTSTKQQGYFNYLHGIMLSQTNINQAEKYFKKAIELGLSMDMDLAVAKLNLAGVAMSRRRKLEATTLLNEAKRLDKQGMLKEQITMMKDQMKKI